MQRAAIAIALLLLGAVAVLGATFYVNGVPLDWGDNGEYTFEPQPNRPTGGSVADITNGLVRQWDFNLVTNGTTWDYSDTADHASINEGTASEPLLVSSNDLGLLVNAYDFDGVSDCLVFGTNALQSSAGTISFWVWYDATNRADMNIHIFDSTNVAYATFFGVYSSRGRPGFWWRQDQGAHTIVRANTALSSGAWHHVTCTADGTNYLVYTDGAEQDTTNVYTAATGEWMPSWDAVSPYQLGRMGGDYSGGLGLNYFNGKMTYVRIWNRALSSNDVAYLYEVEYAELGLP